MLIEEFPGVKPGSGICLCPDSRAEGVFLYGYSAYCPECNPIMVDFRWDPLFEPNPRQLPVRLFKNSRTNLKCPQVAIRKTITYILHESTHWLLFLLEGREACAAFDALVADTPNLLLEDLAKNRKPVQRVTRGLDRLRLRKFRKSRRLANLSKKVSGYDLRLDILLQSTQDEIGQPSPPSKELGVTT